MYLMASGQLVWTGVPGAPPQPHPNVRQNHPAVAGGCPGCVDTTGSGLYDGQEACTRACHPCAWLWKCLSFVIAAAQFMP